MKFWFKPKRFWKYFAFYVPSSRLGWLSTIILFLLAIGAFIFICKNSTSLSDIFFDFGLVLISLLIIFDFLCFKFGEFPSWWRKMKR